MVYYSQLLAPCITVLLFANQVYAQSEQDVTDAPSQEEDSCASLPVEDYNLGLRIGSIFIILVTSALGTYIPIIMHRISPYKEGGARDWLLTIGKFFGTGVILATAFVHMLPSAFDSFGSPCLTEGWLSYGSFAGVFCMIASFVLQLVEILSVSHVNKLRKREHQAIEIELNHSHIKDTNKEPSEALSETIASKGTWDINEGNDIHYQHAHEHRIDNIHGHQHGVFFEEDNAHKHVSTYILELGISMHSVLIGVALGTTSNDEFITLLIALVFHQFFEGMALGTRLNYLGYKHWYKAVLMGLIYVIMTPIGTAIGVGIRSAYNPNSLSAVLSTAILDSLATGILLYNAYVSLMSMEISHSPAFHNSTTKRKVCSFISMYVGAGVMSLIGEWA